MNFLSKQYSNDTLPKTNDIKIIKEFGIEQLGKLFSFLGEEISQEMLFLLNLLVDYTEFDKNEVILENDQPIDNIYFIISGGVGFYSSFENIQSEIPILIYDDGNIVTVIDIFLEAKLSTGVKIVACKKTKMLVLNKLKLNLMMQSEYATKMEKIIQKAVLLYYEFSFNIFHLLHMQSDEKINFLYKFYPSLIFNIPQKLVASFLNLKPETFSRSKKALQKKNNIAVQS